MKSFFDSIVDLVKTYTAALPTSVVAVILIIVGLKIGKTILKLIGLGLIVLAVVFYVLKV
jgi:hypothetical protein